MADFYQQLIQDHITLTKVLNALDHAVSYYNEDQDNEPNLPLILEILDYIQVYPEKFHHPLEDQAFNYLLTHDLCDKKIIVEIQQQHKSLEKKTLHLCKQFNAIANDCVVSMDKLHDAMKQYITTQKNHMATEHEKIFPTLAKLDEQAWWDIASGLIIKGDPLFEDDPQRRSFTTLATAIIQEQHENGCDPQ